MSDDAPKCDKCGLEITTGAMAAFCPQAMQCEFWPHSNGDKEAEGGELLIAQWWIKNACEQIGLQIDDRKKLSAALAEIAEIVEGKADCDDDADGFARVPNDAMRIEMVIDRVMPKT